MKRSLDLVTIRAATPSARALAVRCAVAVAVAIVLGACREPPPLPPYVPTPPEVVQLMLKLGEVGPNDVVYDLGCGDGRIVIAAAKRGARGVCVEFDPILIAKSKGHARLGGVYDKIEFRTEDVLVTDFSDATVVMLALSRELNMKLQPKIERLPPGTRIVSHWHDMGLWKPEQLVRIDSAGGVRPVYRWTVRAK